MGNFNRKNTSKGRDNRGDRGDRQMHRATCAECGKDCEVPFKPSGGKPVYCSNCFEGDRSPRGGGGGRGRDRGRDNRDDRQMHRATCAECRRSCEVPFRPSGDKPVYCSNCFSKGDSSGPRSGSRKPDQSNKKHDEINAKLDKILFLLQGGADSAKEVAVKKPKKKKEAVKKAEKKVAKKKVAKKKVATKKAVKKVVAKKPTKKAPTKKKKK